MNGTCRMCYKRSEVKEVVPNVPVCKACGYAIGKTFDFFVYFGYGMQPLPSQSVEGTEKSGLDIRSEQIAKEEEQSSKLIGRRVSARNAGKDKG